MTKIFIAFLLIISCAPGRVFGQTDANSETDAIESLLYVNYLNVDNKYQLVKLEAKTKDGRLFKPAKGVKVKVYLDADSSEAFLIDSCITDEKGLASVAIPASLAEAWKSSVTHTFLAIADAAAPFGATHSDLTISKAKLAIDTINDGSSRSVRVQLLAMQNDGTWQPVTEGDVKVGIRRLTSNLSVGEEESFTIDESGEAIASFDREGIPGDEQGNIVLIAAIVDNDTYGNLQLQAVVPWGKPTALAANTDARNLWSDRTLVPYWLLFLISAITLSVWAVVGYMAIQFFRMKRLASAD